MKKLFLSLGVATSIAAPIVATVSCGNNKNEVAKLRVITDGSKVYVAFNDLKAHMSIDNIANQIFNAVKAKNITEVNILDSYWLDRADFIAAYQTTPVVDAQSQPVLDDHGNPKLTIMKDLETGRDLVRASATSNPSARASDVFKPLLAQTLAEPTAKNISIIIAPNNTTDGIKTALKAALKVGQPNTDYFKDMINLVS